MPNDKMYKFGVGIDQKSLNEAKKQLGKLAESFESTMQEIESKGLNASNRSKAKSELMSIMKLTEKQAAAVQDMMNGVIPSDEKQLNALKQNVKNLTTFMSDAMQRMTKAGASVDWMKNGASFVDTFTHMKSTLETTVGTIDGLKTAIGGLNQSFDVLKEAFATIHPGAFGKRFGAEVRATTDEIKKASTIIDSLQAQERRGIKGALKVKKDDTIFDYTGSDIDRIRQAHSEIQGAISNHLSTIAKLEAQYVGREKSLYANADYKEAIHGLFIELENFKNLKNTGSFADAFANIGTEASEGIKGVTVDIKNATDNAVKQIKDALSGIEGIELTVKLPDANSEKFVGKIDKFVKDATKHFKTKPISVFAQIKNPFTETIKPDGSQSNDIVDKFTESLKEAKDVINAGYKELTTAVNNDNSTLKDALTLKFGYKKSANDEVITDALAEMQKTIYEGTPLNVVFETENVAEKLAENIQKALKGIELPTFNVPTFSTDHFSTEQFSGGAIPVQVVGFVPISQEQGQTSQPKQETSPQQQSKPKQENKKAQTPVNNASKNSATKPTKEIGELRITNALNKLLSGLKDAMQTQQNIIDRETANIKAHNKNLETHESDIQAARKRNEIIDKRLEEPNARKDKIQAEQKIIVSKLQEAKDAYATKYQELFAGDEYKKIRGLDEGLAVLQENLRTTQQEYADKLGPINKAIKETNEKLNNAKSQEEKSVLLDQFSKQRIQRSKIVNEYTEKLSLLEASIAKNREAYAIELDKNINAQKIDAELQPLRATINDVATQLQAKKEELDAVVKEIQKIKVDVRSEQLNKQLEEPNERKKKLQEESNDLTEQRTKARNAYDEKYKELLATKDGSTIGALDKTYEILQNNYNKTKTEYEQKIQQINDNITEIQKRRGTSAVVDRQIPELIKAQEEMRAEAEAKYTAELAKIESDIKMNRDNHANALRGDDNASRIYGELQTLKKSASDLADKLAVKQKELESVLEEINVIKKAFQDGEDLLGEQNPKEQIKTSTRKVNDAQKESGKIQSRIGMVQGIINDGEDPSKYVLAATNAFWRATKDSIATAEKSMMKRATNDAMKDNLKELFEKQKTIEALDPQSKEYKDAKARIDELWAKIDEAAKALTGQDAKTFNAKVSQFKNAYGAREGMSLLGLNDMSKISQEEALKIVGGLLSKHTVTSESIANLGKSYGLKDLSDYVGIAKTAIGVEDKTFAQYDQDLKAENALIQLARNMEMLKRLYQAFPRDGELPSASTIEKFIQYFGGFAEMGDVVESAAKYLTAIQNINTLKEDIPLLQTLDDNGILEEQLPKLFKTMYGKLGDDDRQKLSTIASGYGLKDADITKLDGDVLADAFTKMSTAFANNAFKDLDIQSPIFKQIEKLLDYNASVISARKDLQDAVDYRRGYLQSATYTTQGRVGGSSRTKTNNIYDVLQSNTPLNVRVVNDKNDYVASIYSPKGSPGEANRKYKANPTGLSNFVFEAGIKNEMSEIVEASLRETLLNNVSSMLASWSDGYTPTTSEIFQLASALPEEFNAGDFIDEDGVVIEIDELREYVKKQKEDMVTASQLMRELVESGRIQVSLGKNSITPDYAKKDDNYSDSSTSKQLKEEERLNKEIKALQNKDYSFLDKETRARLTGDYSQIDDVTKARITGDYSTLNSADQKKAKELGPLLSINVDDLIADKQAELDALRKVRISTEKEIDAIIAIEDDLQARKAKRNKILGEKKVEESTASILDRYGKNANQYISATNREKSKYTYGHASVDELLSNIAFAKSYGVGDVSKLEEVADRYRKALANKAALEESGATEEKLEAAIKEVDAAEEALIEQYFDNNSWRVTKYLQQQFANAKTNHDASMRALQDEIDASENAQQKTEDEINKLHTDNLASINESQMSLSHKYLETPELDMNKQTLEYEKVISEKKKDIEKRREALDAQAEYDPRIAKLRAEAEASMNTDEYKALRLEWQKSLSSNEPDAKQKQKELKAKLDAYEQEYQNAKNKWVTTKSNQLDEELNEFISSMSQQLYASAYANHEVEITAKKEEIATKKKALTKDVNSSKNAPEVARLKKLWKDLEAKAKTAEDTNDREGAIKLDNQAQDAKERYEVAKRSWIASQAANLDQELIDYIKQLELNDKTVANFNANLPEGAKVVNSIEDVRNYIRETHEHLLAIENERFKKELEVAKNGTSSIDVEGRKKAIEQQEEEDRQNAIKTVTKNGSIMSDAQFMAKQHRDAAAEKAIRADEEKKEIDRLERERQVIRERAQVEDEAIAERRAVIQEEREANTPPTPRATQQNGAPALAMIPSGSGGTTMMALSGAGIEINTAALVADLSSSNLAREGTLRGIYELLNGGSPKGGWDGINGATTQPKGNTGGQSTSASVADIAQQDADKIFATSVSKILKQLSRRTTREAMAFIGADGHIGKLIEGTKDSVPGDKISAALAAEVKKVFAMIHNHPSKIAGISDIDLDSAVKYAYSNKPIKVHGTVANGLLTSVNFDGIDETTANAILGEYNKSLMQLAKDQSKSKLFGVNKDGRFAIKDVRNNPELQKEVSEAIYSALKNAFAAFKHGDAVQQVGIDNLDSWSNSIIPKAQQNVEPTTPQAPTQRATQQQNGMDVTKVTTTLDNIAMLANSASLDFKRLIQAIGLVSKHPILSDRTVYADRHVEIMSKIVNTLNHAINSKDFGMISEDDAEVVKQLRDYLASLEIPADVGEQNNQEAVASAERHAQAEKEVADAAERRAQAETEVTAEKSKETSAQSNASTVTSSNNIWIPQSSHPEDGGIFGLAKESTLQKIYDALSNGVKVTTDGNGGSSGGDDDGQSKKQSITTTEAEEAVLSHIGKNYKNYTQLGDLKPTADGYAIDVIQPRLKEIEETQQKINQLEQEGKQNTNEYAQAQTRLNNLKLEQEKVTLRISKVNNEIQITEKKAIQNLALGTKAATKELQTVEGIMTRLHDSHAISIDDNGGYNSDNDTIKKYLQSVGNLRSYSGSSEQELSELAIKAQNARKEVTLLLDAIDRYNNGKHFGTFNGELGNNIDIKTTLKDMLSGSGQAIKEFGDLEKVTNKYGETVAYKLTYNLQVSKREVQEMTAVINPLTREITLQEGALKTVSTGWEKFWSGLKAKAASIVQYIASITSIQDMIRYAREGVQYVREIDASLTELKKVTDETDASYSRFLQNMAKTGSVIGATVSDLTTMAAEWSRLGYSMADSAKLAESTAILLNVSEFNDATEASEALISTMQAFQYTAAESQHVVDILNEVGNNYAVSSDGLAVALQDSASALMEAGANLEQATALVAAANKVIQDPSSVGSALRTISLRLRGTSVKVLEEMGEETDGVVESTSKLQAKLKALTGVDILTDAGGYKDVYTILKEIGAVWQDLEKLDKAAALELMAGKNRANTLSAILNNMEDLEGAYNDALQAEGSALKENEAYLESVQGHIDVFNNLLQTMWMNFIDTDVIKWFIHLGDEVLKLVDNVGLLQTAFVTLGGYGLKKYFGDTLFSTPKDVQNNLTQLQNIAKQAYDTWMNNPSIDNKKAYEDATKNLEAYDAELKRVNETTEVVGNTSENTGSKMSGAFNKASVAAGKHLEHLKQLAKSMIAMYAVSTAIELLSDLWKLATNAIKENSDSFDDLQDKYENLSSELSTCESELKSFESELETTNKQIEEMMLQGTLSFVEQEELERLQAISSELERQISMKKTLQSSLSTGTSSAAMNAGNAYLDTSFNSDKSKTERQEEGAETGKKIGQALGLVGSIAGVIIAAAAAAPTGGLSLSAIPGILATNATTIGLTTFGVGAIGELVGNTSSGVKYDQEQKVGEAIESMNKTRDKLIRARDETYEAYTSDPTNTKMQSQYESAAQALSLYDEKMASHISTMSQYYNTIMTNWNNATDTQKNDSDMLQALEAAKEYGDAIDKYNIEMGGKNAKVNAIDRIFGAEADAKLQSVKDALKEMADEGDKINLKEAFGEDTDAYDTFVKRLYDMGIYVYECENAFKQMHDAAEEAASVDFIDIAKDVNGVSEAINGLKTAFEEFLQGGTASSDTILGLEQYFNNTDDLKELYNEYVGIMLSGNASIKDAKNITAKLAQEYLDNAISTGELTTSHKQMYISRLRDLGISNADEFVNHELQQAAINKMESEFKKEGSISTLRLTEIANTYGVELDVLSQVVNKLKEKNELEAQKDTAFDNLQGYNNYITKLQTAQEELDKLNIYSDDIKNFNPDEWKYDGSKHGYVKFNYETATYDKINSIVFEKMKKQKEEYLAAVAKAEEEFNKIVQEGFEAGYLNDDYTIKDGVSESYQNVYNDAVAAFEAAKNEIENQLGFELELEFVTKLDPNTISDLTNAIATYKDVVSLTSEIVSDGQVVTEEYKQSLVDLGIDITEINACFDDNNKLIVKDAKALNNLVKRYKNVKKASIDVAKAQAQLEYRKLAQQIVYSVEAMMLEYKANNLIIDATYNNIDALREQMDVLKETIQQYSLLEIGLTDAAKAYDDYEKAKTRDEQIAYDESFEEMLKTLDEGFLKNETGTEAFEFAARAIIPEIVWEGIEDPTEKVREMHDYLDGDPLFAKLFTVDKESGDLSVTTDNVREFVNLMKEANLISGDSNGFNLTENVDGIESVVKGINELGVGAGVTEASVLALLSKLEESDALWGNILSDITTPKLERDVNRQVDILDEATKKVEDYWKAVMSGDEEYDETKLAELTSDVEDAIEAYGKAEQAANDNAQNWNLCNAAISSYRGELSLTQKEADELSKSLGLIDENGNPTLTVNSDGSLQLTDEQLALVLAKIKDLDEPAIVRIQLRYDELVAQYDDAVSKIEEIKKYINDEITSPENSTVLIDLGINHKGEAYKALYELQGKLDELTAEKKQIELTYNITETSEDQEKSVLESYQELAKNGLQFTVTADVQNAKDGLDSVTEAQDNIKEEQKITFTTNASTVEQAIKGFVDEYDKIMSKVITLTVNIEKKEVESVAPQKTLPGNTTVVRQRATMALGNARANGSIGLKSAENNTVVGEIGPELVVDPINGVYYTVGNNGTEMVNLPRGAIIYNHKQTEELLKNGRTSRGYYTGGLSFARGNAYADYGIPDYHPNNNDKTSFENGLTINNTWDDATSSLSNALSEAADSVGEFEETIDWIEIRMEELDEVLGLYSAHLENAATYDNNGKAKNDIINDMINVNKDIAANANAGAEYYKNYAEKYLVGMSKELADAARNGAISITEFTKEQDEATVKAIQNYRDFAQKSADLTQKAVETIAEIRNLAIQKIDNFQDYGSAKTNIEDLQTEKLQNMVDYLETKGEIPASAYYGTNGGNAASSTGMFENSYKKKEYWSDVFDDMQKAFDEAVQTGRIQVGTVEWYEQLAKLYEAQAEIDAATIELEEFQNAINDIYWDNFDQLINRLDYLKDETQSLIDLMGHGDMVTTPETEDGWVAEQVEWTEEGLASLGLYAQQMEIAEYTAKQYAKAIDDLTRDYKSGLYSENEYLEKLNELKSAQYDSIEAYYDAQDAIKDLQEARVDAIKNGIEKEVDAYEKLINKKKEALSAEKDLHDFQKQSAEQSKNIAQIERQLVALANDHSMAAMAKKRQLEAELAEAKAEQEELYYDRSIENQQTALDKELDSFKEQKDAELQKWDEYLENVELLVTESLGIIKENAAGIGQTLTDKANEYNLTVSDAITKPWADGSLAVSDYQTTFDTAMSSTMDQLEALKASWQGVIDKMVEAGNASVNLANKQNAEYAAAKKQETTQNAVSNTTQQNTTKTEDTKPSNTRSEKDYYGVALAIWQDSAYYGWGRGKTRDNNLKYKGFDPYKAQEIVNKIGEDGYIKNGTWRGKYHGIRDLSPYHINRFAKGTTDVGKDQWALIDELGDELVMHASGGKLAFLTKGSAVIPHDISENLMTLGSIDPQDMLDRNRPAINAPHIVNNEININMNIAEVVHVDRVDHDTLPDLTKAVKKEMDSYFTKVNNAIKSKVR